MIKESCTDCGSTTRKLIQASPKVHLCATCTRDRKKTRRVAGQRRRQQQVFGLTLEERDQLIEYQGGGCICKDWTGYNGATRSLSTDHDHETGVVRGALCKHCNDLLGRVKDDPRYFQRMIAYLTHPPAVQLFGARYVPGGPTR